MILRSQLSKPVCKGKFPKIGFSQRYRLKMSLYLVCSAVQLDISRVVPFNIPFAVPLAVPLLF